VPCIKLPGFPAFPSLTGGVSLPIFPGLTLPSLGLCCKLRLPAFPVPAIAIGVAFPQGLVATINAYVAAAQSLYDSLEIPCPNLPDSNLPSPPPP
jgi:hypothetical protein